MKEETGKIKEIISKEKKLAGEFNSLLNYSGNEQEKVMIKNQIEKLKISLRETNNELKENLDKITIKRPLKLTKEEIKKPDLKKANVLSKKKNIFDILKGNNQKEISELDRKILKRLKGKKEKKIVKKERKASDYVKFASKLFSERVRTLVKQKKLATLEKDLIKSNLNYTSIAYISIIALTTLISVIASFVIFLFFLFFNLSLDLPIITMATEGLGIRFLKTFWIIFVIPLGTFLFMYLYPSMEKKSSEAKINQEIPFATINMAAIAGSHIEPIKLFRIISSTEEYPALEKEFNKLLNAINIYGYDLVTALKDAALNCPSQKLADLFNGLATTITSGGSLYDFFEKRSQSMLFEYKINKEKNTKTAETFMDIYISVVIAAPMILMLLLMMMKISGLGVVLSTSTITLIMVMGVSLINIIFLIFLQLKQPKE